MDTLAGKVEAGTIPSTTPGRFARALVVAAHPDDPEFLFGATIARLVHQGASLGYVICSDGANGSRDLTLDAEDLVARRSAEQRDAAAVLGVSVVEFLGFRDGRLVAGLELRREIARAIRPFRPDLILTHFPHRVLHLPIEASHPDHVAVGEATLAAVFPEASNGRALLEDGLPPHHVSEVWIPGYEGANHVVDATPFLEIKVRAILSHKTQVGPVAPPWVYSWMRQAGAKSAYNYAEDFQRILLR